MPDLKHYKGREQGFIKHSLIEKYLENFAIKIFSRWNEIVYIDAFAGPWGNQADDFSDTSFHIALKCLRKGLDVASRRNRNALRVQAFLIEKDQDAFDQLATFGRSQNNDVFRITCLHGAFETRASDVRQNLDRSSSSGRFTFALIDPLGWSGLSMGVIAPLVHRRSSEVLVNVMTSKIHRFLDAEQCHDSYKDFFGRPGVREIILNTPGEDRQDAVVRQYCRSLREHCNFKYVSSCVVLDPGRRQVKYFMVFGTNSPVGIRVFKEAEKHAANLQDEVRGDLLFNGQQFFDLDGVDHEASAGLRGKYRKIAFARVEELLTQQPDSSYREVFCKAMAIPLVTEEELLQFLNGDPRFTVSCCGKTRRKPRIDDENDRILMRQS